MIIVRTVWHTVLCKALAGKLTSKCVLTLAVVAAVQL